MSFNLKHETETLGLILHFSLLQYYNQSPEPRAQSLEPSPSRPFHSCGRPILFLRLLLNRCLMHFPQNVRFYFCWFWSNEKKCSEDLRPVLPGWWKLADGLYIRVAVAVKFKYSHFPNGNYGIYRITECKREKEKRCVLVLKK